MGTFEGELEERQALADGTAPATDLPESFAGFTKRDLYRNVIFLTLLDAIAMTGFTDFQIALNPLLVHLKANDAVIGLVTSLMFFSLPGLILCPLLSRRFRFKKWLMIGTYAPHITTLAVAGIVLIFAKSMGLSTEWLLVFVVGTLIVYYLLNGFVSLPHQEYVAACIPMKWRGRYTGWSFTAGSLFGIAAATAATWVLKHVAEPRSYGYLFIMTWVLCLSGYVFALFAKESPSPIEETPKAWSKDMWLAVWEDKRFMRFVLVMLFGSVLVNPFLPFVTIFGQRNLGLGPEVYAQVNLLIKIVSLGTALVAGMLTDKLGPRRTYPIFWSFITLSFLAPLLMPNATGIFVNAGLFGIGNAAAMPAYAALMYGLPSPKNRSGHYTILFVVSFLLGSLGPIIAGAVCHTLGYAVAFKIAFALGVIFIALLVFFLNPKLSDDARSYD